MLRTIIFMLATLVSLTSCRTGKTVESVEQTQEQSVEELSVDIQKKDFDLGFRSRAYDLKSLDFGYNFTLSTLDSAKPARLIEYREGKPFRELGIENGNYTESKAVKDSTTLEAYRALEYKFNTLKTLYSRHNKELNQLKITLEKTKVEGKKLANNFKYLLWVLLAAAVIWIGQSTGLFMVFKRLLKRV